MKTSIRLALLCGVMALAPAAEIYGAGQATPAPKKGRAPVVVSADEILRLESLASGMAVAAPAKPRKILIYCQLNGFRSAGIPYVNKAFEILGRKSGAFTVAAISEDPAMLTPEKLKEFDAIVLNNCNELRLDEARSRALQDFVKHGKGVVGLGATISIRNWPEQAEMMGGFCFRHPFARMPLNPLGEWAVKVEDPPHPLTQMLDRRGFKTNDVIYQVVGPYSRDKMRVLLSLDLSDPRAAAIAEVPGTINRTFSASRADKDFGVAWIRPYGDGRVFVNLLTHVRGDMLFDPAMLRHFLDGLQFAVGDLKLDTSPNPLRENPRSTPAVRAGVKTPAQWAALLSSPNADIRIEAALALGDLGMKAEAALPALVDLLKDPAADIRFFGAKALGRIGPAAVPVVAGLLQDTNPLARAAAARALGNIGSAARKHAPQITALIEDKELTVRTEAILALGKVGAEMQSTVPTLIKLLGDEVPAVTSAAFDALRSMGPAARDALPVLTQLLRRPDDRPASVAGGFYTRGPTMDALQTVAAMSALPEAGDAIIASTFLFRGNGTQGLCPALVFETMGDNAKPAVPALIGLLQEPNPSTRGYVAQALGYIGASAQSAIPALTTQLNDQESFPRVSAAEALGRIGLPAMPVLIEALQNKDWLVRVKAADGLGALGSAARPAVPALTTALRDGDAEVRRSVAAALPRLKIPAAGQPHENGLGMRFVPVPGTGVLFSIWETRVRDFEDFARATEHRADGKIWTWRNRQRGSHEGSWRNPGFAQEATHPVCAVSWDDAQAFCRWLTRKERAAGRLGPDQHYRLPADAEWSVAVGLPNEAGATPADKSDRIEGVYPWGTQYPPPVPAGNYGDRNWDPRGELAGYDDGNEFTAPVGSYPANRHGLHDLGGNVAEWCEDEFLPGGSQHVLRGASFRRGGGSADLLSSHRGRAESGRDNRFAYHGFRVVLVVEEAP